jgi:Zn-dependent protease
VFRLGRLFGIDLTASWTWVVMPLLLVYVARTSFRLLLVDVSPALVWLLAVAAAALSVASLYAHELAHALVALRFSMPVRSINLFLLGGMAHIGRDSPSPRAELLIALAGPSASLAIGVAGAGFSWALWRSAPHVAALGLWLATMNIPVAIFNLVPAYPLDGGRVLRSLLWFAGDDPRWGSTVAARVGQVAAAGFLLVGLYLLFTDPANAFGGLWLALVAWFMYGAAVSARKAAAFAEVLPGAAPAPPGDDAADQGDAGRLS